MRGLIQIPIEGGGSVLVEATSPAPSGPIPASGSAVAGAVSVATQTLQTALVSIKDASRAVLEQLREAEPDEIEVEFGVELTAETGAIIAKAGGGCHLNVTLTWAKYVAAG